MWDASSGATGYTIYRDRGVGNSGPIDETSSTIPAGSASPVNYLDESVVNGQTYRYAIVATNSAGSSDRSGIVSATAGVILSIAADGDPDMEGVQSIMPIPERAGGAAITVAALLATTADNGDPLDDVVYAIAESSGAHPFVITDGRLVLPADAAIDYETHSNFTIDIQAESGDRLSGSIGITVSIENVDDEAPVFGSAPDIVTIQNGASVFDGGALTVAAIDDLGNEIEYAFLNDDSSTANAVGDFSIDSGTGAITVMTAPMYDTANAAANRRELTIQASDTSTGAIGDRVSTVEITILITPMSSLTPQSTAGDTIAIDESDDTAVDATTISVTNPASPTPYTITGWACRIFDRRRRERNRFHRL